VLQAKKMLKNYSLQRRWRRNGFRPYKSQYTNDRKKY